MILHRCFIFMFCFSLLNGMDNERPKTGFKIIFSNKLNDLLKGASKLNPVSFFTKVKEEQNRLYGNFLCAKYRFIETFNSDKSDVKRSKVVFPFFDYINMPDEEKEEIFSTHPKVLQKILECYKKGGEPVTRYKRGFIGNSIIGPVDPRVIIECWNLQRSKKEQE